MERGFIYCVTCLTNGKQYIGQTILSVQARWSRHIRNAKKNSDCKFHRAIRKHGADKFTVEELLAVSAPTKKELKVQLDSLEIEYISRFNTRDRGYNSTDGGEGKLGSVISKETREKIRVSHFGSRNPMFGKKHSEEHRKKISESMKGHKNTLGLKMSEKSRERMSRAKGCKEIIQVSIDGKPVKTWISISEIKKVMRVNRELLKKHILSGTPYFGYIWKLNN